MTVSHLGKKVFPILVCLGDETACFVAPIDKLRLI